MNEIDSSTSFKEGGKVYRCTNENITGYLSKIPQIRGGDVLSVCASGDHAFESLMHGARHVDVFDINSCQNDVMRLKMQMIYQLNLRDFCRIIDADRLCLSDVLRYPVLGYKIHQMNKRSIGHTYMHPVYYLSYLSSQEKFSEMRDKLPETINFIHTDIEQLTANVTQQYDVILLSNIIQYMYDHYFNPYNNGLIDAYQNFYTRILLPMADKILKPGGVICWGYYWGVDEGLYLGQIKYAIAQLKDSRLYNIYIPSTRHHKKRDMVLAFCGSRQR